MLKISWWEVGFLFSITVFWLCRMALVLPMWPCADPVVFLVDHVSYSAEVVWVSLMMATHRRRSACWPYLLFQDHHDTFVILCWLCASSLKVNQPSVDVISDLEITGSVMCSFLLTRKLERLCMTIHCRCEEVTPLAVAAGSAIRMLMAVFISLVATCNLQNRANSPKNLLVS